MKYFILFFILGASTVNAEQLAGCKLAPYNVETVCYYNAQKVYYNHFTHYRICKPEFQNGKFPADLLEECAASPPWEDGKLTGACDEFYDYATTSSWEIYPMKDMAVVAGYGCLRVK